MTMDRDMRSPVGAEINIGGAPYVSFGGSSYLGLAGNAEILEAGRAALAEFGAGMQFPREFHHTPRTHHEAEAEAATFFGTESALHTGNGYFFGLIAIPALRARCNTIFFDEMSHFSLRDAIAASGLPNHAFRHLDAGDLETQLRRHLRAGDRPLVITDAVYSVVGLIAPVADYARVMMPFDGRLLVDEAHSFGVLGENGRGVTEHHRIPEELILRGGSTGKALGVSGGIIPASHNDVEALRASPAFRGSAGGLPAVAAMCAKSLSYIRQHPELLVRLRANVAQAKKGFRSLGLSIPDNEVPILSFVAGAARSMSALQARLMSEGIFVYYSNYIGAGADGAIRCAIFADHTAGHIDRLIDALRRLL